MNAKIDYFQDLLDLKNHLGDKVSGNILIGYRNLPDYAGMVLGIGIIFDIRTIKYELDLEWISFGLDLYGENLLENYLYKFHDLQELTEYIEKKYGIKISDIPISYKINQSLFPNPIKDAELKPQFEHAWERFKEDFKKGTYLDNSLELVYSSID